MSAIIMAQAIMFITLILMVIGRTPLYLTAIIGSTLAALTVGIPLYGGEGVSIAKLVINGLNPVLADMTGILLFIGIMHKTGFLSVIIRDVIKLGNYVGGGPGIITAASIAAGFIGMMVGFTQAVITGVIAGPAALKLGVKPDSAAGALQHANILGCGAGFAHPTQVAIITMTGVGFGMVNVYGAITAAAVMVLAYWRMHKDVIASGTLQKYSAEEMEKILKEFESHSSHISSITAIIPFAILVIGFVLKMPIFIVGFFASLITILLSKINPTEGEKAMVDGVQKIAVPLVATICFLYMSGVINNIGIAALLSEWLKPGLDTAPILLLFGISLLTGIITQSYSASAAIILPFLDIVLKAGGHPMLAAVAAISGGNLGQYFLTGGPVSGLSTVTPVVQGSSLLLANRFQRPNIAFSWLVALLLLITLGYIYQ